MGYKKEQKFTGVVRARVHENIKISLPKDCNLSDIFRASLHPALFTLLTEHEISISETLQEMQKALYEQLNTHLYHHDSLPKKITLHFTLS